MDCDSFSSECNDDLMDDIVFPERLQVAWRLPPGVPQLADQTGEVRRNGEPRIHHFAFIILGWFIVWERGPEGGGPDAEAETHQKWGLREWAQEGGGPNSGREGPWVGARRAVLEGWARRAGGRNFAPFFSPLRGSRPWPHEKTSKREKKE